VSHFRQNAFLHHQGNMLLTAERAMRKERTLVATGFEAGDPDRRHCDPFSCWDGLDRGGFAAGP
jgi:hypothetical protein